MFWIRYARRLLAPSSLNWVTYDPVTWIWIAVITYVKSLSCIDIETQREKNFAPTSFSTNCYCKEIVHFGFLTRNFRWKDFCTIFYSNALQDGLKIQNGAILLIRGISLYPNNDWKFKKKIWIKDESEALRYKFLLITISLILGFPPLKLWLSFDSDCY